MPQKALETLEEKHHAWFLFQLTLPCPPNTSICPMVCIACSCPAPPIPLRGWPLVLFPDYVCRKKSGNQTRWPLTRVVGRVLGIRICELQTWYMCRGVPCWGTGCPNYWQLTNLTFQLLNVLQAIKCMNWKSRLSGLFHLIRIPPYGWFFNLCLSQGYRPPKFVLRGLERKFVCPEVVTM